MNNFNFKIRNMVINALKLILGVNILHLKRLEIKGFKSFLDKTVLEFDSNITAIVGPNGSGKSNISDAIRWVLGEQSAKSLRGSKMDDVIFAGTEIRKPLGCAEVLMTLDNSDKILPLDYNEITVMRRLYRSGESEYYINNTLCRLKDVQELFLDTGIGKDGYSLIGQGKIDEILSSRSEDRRNIFEEAAGIVKYKMRLSESQKKLENTKQNLLRISDIVSELKNQIEPLEKQSKNAKIYLSMIEELKNDEINLALNNYENSKIKLDKITHDLKELNDSKLNYDADKEELKNIILKLKDNLRSCEELYEKNNNLKFDLEKNKSINEGRINLLSERHCNSLDEIKRIRRQIDDEQSNLNKIEDEEIIYIKNKKSCEAKLEELNKALSIVNEECLKINNNTEEFDKSIDDKKSDAIQNIKNTSDINNQINSHTSMVESLKSRINGLKKEIELRESRIEGINSEINSLELNVKSLTSDNEKYKKTYNDALLNLNSLRGKQGNLSNKKNSLYENLKTKEARLNTLIHMENSLEGYNKGVKAILKNKYDKVKVFGTVSNIISVPTGLETAIEVALSSSIQNIIVDNEKTAEEMINYLKNENIGRATFLPLSTIKRRKVNFNNELSQINGFVGFASELIRYDEMFNNVISFLLGRIIICTNLKIGTEIAKKTGYTFKLVTLDGDVINAGGSYTGGSRNVLNNGIISRKNELADISEKVKVDKSNYNSISIELNNIENEIKNQNEIVSSSSTKIKEIEFKIKNENNKKDMFASNMKNIVDDIKYLKIEMDKIYSDIDSYNNLIDSNKDKLKDLMKLNKNYEEEIQELNEKLLCFKNEKETLINKITNKKIEIAEQNKIIENLNENLINYKKNKETCSEKINLFNDEIKEKENLILEIKKEIEYISSSNEKIEKDIESTLNAIKELELKKENIRKDLEQNENKMKDVDESLNLMINSIHKLEIAKSKIESEIDFNINKLWEDYEITIPQASKYKKDIKNYSELSKKTNDLKSKIKELGNVNVNAIEEYKEVTERYNFLTKQREDLKKAELDLLKVIETINLTMKNQFNEKFNIIRENFNEVFKELFGGGYADLRLEGNDVLNDGIDIIVQPPGKKLQSLSLLSGGEKGLSAIALVFAILKMKPTPFCVLDEIEAALDDANVNRFSNFLKRYSKETQFIVITHRKGSMAAAEALYGVTMEEKGVSKVLSLKL